MTLRNMSASSVSLISVFQEYAVGKKIHINY